MGVTVRLDGILNMALTAFFRKTKMLFKIDAFSPQSPIE